MESKNKIMVLYLSSHHIYTGKRSAPWMDTSLYVKWTHTVNLHCEYSASFPQICQLHEGVVAKSDNDRGDNLDVTLHLHQVVGATRQLYRHMCCTLLINS